MKSLAIFLWNSLLNKIPFYCVRSFFLNLIFDFDISKKAAMHRCIEFVDLGGLYIGDESTINRRVHIDTRGKVSIGNNVSISPDVRIITASHDVDASGFDLVVRPVYINDYVWVGTGAIILPGVCLGEGCVVAAGSVVTKSVPKYTVVGGNPAVFIRKRSNDLNYTPHWKPRFY